MKKVLSILGIVFLGIAVSVLFVFLMYNFRQNNEIDKMMSYLEEKYDDDFEIVGDLEKGRFRKLWFNFGLDGSNAEAYKNYGMYYRLKVHSKTKNIDFYVQHLTKDKVIEDNYMFVAYREDCKNELYEEFNKVYRGKVDVTYNDIEIDNKTEFSTRNNVKYEVKINADFNPYEIENIKSGIEIMRSLKNYREKYNNDVITVYITVIFNNATIEDNDVRITYGEDVPNSTEIQKLMQIENKYNQISSTFLAKGLDKYDDVTIIYNEKLRVEMKNDNIQVYIPRNYTDGLKGFESGGNFSVKEFYNKYKELYPGVY